MPGISGLVEGHLRQERRRAQQERLQPLAGKLVLVGGNFDEQPTTKTPDQLADRTSRVLIEEGTITEYKPVVIRALVPDTMEPDEPVEEGARSIWEALQRNDDISPYFIQEPQPIATKDKKYEPIMERTHRAIDAAIVDLEQRITAGHDETLPSVYSHLVVMLVARDSIAANSLPWPISRDTMQMGRTALLTKVGETPQENIWQPEAEARLVT